MRFRIERVAGWLLVALLITVGGAARAADPAPFTPDQDARVRALVRETLRDHPEIILDALRELRSREAGDAEQHTLSLIAANRSALEHEPGDAVLGNPAGDVTIVEFFDYRCPYCKQMSDRLFAAAAADGHVRLVMKEFPILGPGSVLAAQAAVASIPQGKYAAFHKALMASRGAIDQAAIAKIAQDVGLDDKRLAADMARPEVKAAVDTTLRLGKLLEIGGTPAFIIGNHYFPGAIEDGVLVQAIGEARGHG